MSESMTLGESLRRRGISRRSFLKYCATVTSLMALSPAMGPVVAATLERIRRPSVIWLSFQECTGCTESLTRSHNPSIEGLIFDFLSLDYHHTLQAASGEAAEQAREEAMRENAGKYLVVVDGSVPLANKGYSTIAGKSNLDILQETLSGAAAVVAVGTCAAFGGLPKAKPNPTGAVAIADIVKDKPIINIPGCPPVPVVITGTLAHYLVFGRLPEMDQYRRPKAFFGTSIHDRCYRRPFYDKGLFAESFDDEGAKKGWCLYQLGCKGPMTYNACAVLKWNDGTSWPVESGHGCLGCSEPGFWDAGGFYRELSVPIGQSRRTVAYAAVTGLVLGGAVGFMARTHRDTAGKTHEAVTVDQLEQKL